jgi:hypothetical protein
MHLHHHILQHSTEIHYNNNSNKILLCKNIKDIC